MAQQTIPKEGGFTLPEDRHIFIVEDDDNVAELLLNLLNRFGYHVTRASTYKNIDLEVKATKPDLIILDINLPQYDGFYWCSVLRRFTTVPILYISARDSGMDQVHALETGGDDYISKPFHSAVVLAKVNALLRRAYGAYAADHDNSPVRTVCFGSLELDLYKSSVTYGGVTETLSKTESELLRQLMAANGAVVKRDQLLNSLWDDIDFVDDNTLTVNVARIRRKLAVVGLPDAIITVRGLGYRIELEGVESSS